MKSMRGHDPFPTRQQWIDFGVRPCQGRRCKQLINPELLSDGYCKTCARRKREGKYG